MEMTKQESKMLKGVAILSMLMLHLFCRKTDLPYTPLLWIGNIPVIYYFGLFGDICVPMYCFMSGYAHGLPTTNIAARWKQLLRFMIRFWTIVVVFSIVGILVKDPNIPGSFGKFILNCLTLRINYNGAWWYANIYIVLIILLPFSVWLVDRFPNWLVLLLSFFYYSVGYGIRFWGWGACESHLLSWFIKHIGLLGTSYFPYIIGMLFCRKGIIGKLRKMVDP